ncbi:MAG TPA: FGGY family carbohydrate kinase, partial [Candidatus Limnocylindrales bacterium]|nr:FGGY family carbohydrate kinase [Candidatus Limnocylindrales bacterium]
MALVLGIDVSTTATKAVLVDGEGAVRGIGAAGHDVQTPQPLWSEGDPAAWWAAATVAIPAALAAAGAGGADVEAVGLTGQMHGAVLLGAGDEVLRPAILWNDQRTGEQCDEIRRRLGKERLIQITGNDA